MEDETNKDEGTQTDAGNTGDEGNTDNADSQSEGTTSKEDAGDKVNWEQRYKAIQGEQTKVSQANADLTRRLDALEQTGSEAGKAEDEGLDDDEGFVDRKTVNKLIDNAVSKAVSTVRTQAANAYFRKNYSDLVKHESIIAGIMRNPKEPSKLKGASAEERIDAAVKEFNELTESAKKEATEKAEAEAKAKEEANRKASGLTSSSTTTPKGGEEEPSDADELKVRKQNQAKKRGLV